MARKGIGGLFLGHLPKGMTKKLGKLFSGGVKKLGKGLSKLSKPLRSGWKKTLSFAKTGAKWVFKPGEIEVHAKVSDNGFYEVHLDTDDANAFLINPGDIGVLKK